MFTALRRVFWLAILGGAGYAGWAAWQARQTESAAPPAWPPIDPPDTSASPAAARAPKAAAPAAAAESPAIAPFAAATGVVTWVAADAGSCPASHPVKANDNSGIFHVPGGRFYDRTAAERCYDTGQHAQADGYRQAKA